MKRLAIFILLSTLSINSWAGLLTLLGAPSSPNPDVFKLAKSAYDCATATGVAKSPTLTIIDYSMPATKKRMWVIDMQRNHVLFNTFVAHGIGSGGVTASRFSNVPQSRATSLGLYKTANSYRGQYGYSLRLIGLDPGYNDNAYARAVVIHGAPYVNGRMGNSWGCPAIPQKLAMPIINRIKDGNLVFAYYPSSAWLKKSKYLNCPRNLVATNNNMGKPKSA
jgi:hypothetical protein